MPPTSRALRPLNVEPALLQGLHEHIAALNAADATLPGRPAVEIARNRAQVASAARLMAQAFVHNQDKGWLAWLPPSEVARVRSGDTRRAQEKIARVIEYLCAAAAFEGGLVLLESADAAEESDASDAREIRGASLWGLPPAVPGTEPWWHLAAFGAPAALRSYGLLRAAAAAGAANALVRASQQTMHRLGLPARCIYAQMGCVRPAHQGQRVSRRMFEPFRLLADRFDLVYRLESSSPETNDQRVFSNFRFEKIGEHHFGTSRFNSVGPYTINLMVRRPGAEAP
ncbi:hypothetical protein [Variovorax sp. YR266]|uniref:hypothetical protein n=1 Tax=Variovorax sp. YR266 TaxID=1884386 RepID=UPI00115FA4DF|nr:hypothetical protein [Variovorax sp. YR266]